MAFVQEGAALRQSGILAPILVLSEQPAAQLDELVRWHLTATAYTTEYLDALAKEARETASPTVRVHLKVDTGMHRVGARPEQLVPLVHVLLAHPELRWEGLWTHLARADAVHAGVHLQVHPHGRARGLPCLLRQRVEVLGRVGGRGQVPAH